jgi:AdoMet-dependent heme synthase
MTVFPDHAIKTSIIDGKQAVPVGPTRQSAFEFAPMLVYWESTRACDLACVHCRAEAVSWRNPLELNTAEVKGLLDQIAAFGGPRLPHLVITGGDPLQREDLFELIAYGRSRNIVISVTPAGTSRLTAVAVQQLKEAGVFSLGLSLDGSDEKRHDTFRGVQGSFQWTSAAAHLAHAADLPVQLNTMVTSETLDDLPRIYELVKAWGIERWALFFLIATGRGETLTEITPVESERLHQWLWELRQEAPFPIKTTEAHHYRRLMYKRLRQQGLSDEAIAHMPVGRGFGIRDGSGIVFVSHTGEVYPSGFLPLKAGNVRWESLVDIYRSSDLFRSLRNPDLFTGKCGQCEYRYMCGGSRARAYAATGDPLGSDPLCPYYPVVG